MTTINQGNAGVASSYPLYGQGSMTENERTEFLSRAREDEANYSMSDYVREDDPQHSYETDPNHPMQIRRNLVLNERGAEFLENELQKPEPVWGDADYQHSGARADLVGQRDEKLVAIQQFSASLDAAYATRASTIEDIPAYLNAMSKPVDGPLNGKDSFHAYLTNVVEQQNKGQAPKASDVLPSVAQTASGTPSRAGNPFDDYLADINWRESFSNRSRAGEVQVAREREEWLANRSVAQTGSVGPSSAMARSTPADVASPLFTQDRTGPADISWHRQAVVNSYQTPIPSEQLARTSREASSGTHAANDKSNNQNSSYPTQAGEVTHDTMQLAAEAPQSTQAGDLLGRRHSSGGMLSAMPLFSKSAMAHFAVPMGGEAISQADAALNVMDKAETDFNKGLLTQEQLEIIKRYTGVTASGASMAALIPEPGIIMDGTVALGDLKLVNELVQANLPKQLAEQYQMGSVIDGSLRMTKSAVYASQNRDSVKLTYDAEGAVPLSKALNINPAQLKQFGAMSETLGGEALKAEVSRNPAFERLTHLSAQKIEKLSQMAAAGMDPLVMDHGHITTTSNRPTQLSADSKAAFMESASYIMQSGDTDFRVPGNRPVVLKASVEAFAKAYEFAAKYGGLSEHDKDALKVAVDKLSKGIETNQLPGVVAKYKASHLPVVAANDAEHAVSV